jgi:cyclohexadieny/prephenate dehydrogenase
MTEHFHTAAIIGIGLIGSSLARALRQQQLVRHIAIADNNAAHLARAAELKLGDSYHADAAQAVAGADLVILCTPIGAAGAVAQQIGAALKPGRW